MKHFALYALAIVCTCGLPAIGSASPPNAADWSHPLTGDTARVGQPFVSDELDVRIERISYVAAYPDGTLPDTGARAVEVRFAAHNAQSNAADLYDSFYPYAELSDGSDTNGEGASFYPLEKTAELGDLRIKAGEGFSGRVILEIPESATVKNIVAFGSIDGKKVSVAMPAPTPSPSPKPRS